MYSKCFVIAFVLVSFVTKETQQSKSNKTLLIFGVTTDVTDAYLLYLRSLKTYGLNIQKTFANGEKYIGHSMKVNLLHKGLENYKDRDDVIVLFTDTYDVVFTGGEDEIIRAFEAFNASMVFSAETNCAPAKGLAPLYPEAPTAYKFLNSGGFIGLAPAIYNLLPKQIPANYDDQLYYTLFYLNETSRAYHGMVLDYNATIFQSMHDAADHVSFEYTDDDIKLINHYTNTTPIIIHGNGNGKYLLHTLSSYLAKSWTPAKGCLACNEGRINLTSLSEEEYPKVFMAIFIERPTPFLEEKLTKISNLSYPKKRIFLFIYSKIYFHEKTVLDWMKKHSDDYLDYNYKLTVDYNVSDSLMRLLAIKTCVYVSCDLYFSIDSEVVIENPDTLNLLISHNRTVLAPVMTEPGTTRSTFWGSISDDEKFNYMESFDYKNIVNNTRRGIWNVPQVWNIYVIKPFMFNNSMYEHALAGLRVHPDQAISWVTKITKNFSMFLYATNLDDYGYLSNMEVMPLDVLHHDLWQVASNTKDWEKKYLHPLLLEQKNNDSINKMVCPDVFMFPLFSEEFCWQMIETVNSNEENWSKSKMKDKRLYSGFENIPTVDIYLHQIGYEKEWHQISKKYIIPQVEKLFGGYQSKDKSPTGFISRYEATNNSSTNPHYDFSTVTVSVALNRKGEDYQGGSIDFLRYNCSVEHLPVGWAIMYPGRLTHIHKLEPVTKGIKYNLFSFVDS